MPSTRCWSVSRGTLHCDCNRSCLNSCNFSGCDVDARILIKTQVLNRIHGRICMGKMALKKALSHVPRTNPKPFELCDRDRYPAARWHCHLERRWIWRSVIKYEEEFRFFLVHNDSGTKLVPYKTRSHCNTICLFLYNSAVTQKYFPRKISHINAPIHMM